MPQGLEKKSGPADVQICGPYLVLPHGCWRVPPKRRWQIALGLIDAAAEAFYVEFLWTHLMEEGGVSLAQNGTRSQGVIKL